MKRLIWVAALVLGLGLLAIPIVSAIRNTTPLGRIEIASGGSGGLFDELAQTYKFELAKYGVTLVTRPDLDGFYTLKALVVDQDSGVMAGIVKGGFVGGQQGRLATNEDNAWHEKDVAAVHSIARLFDEPLWVFTRKTDAPANLRDLAGRRIYIGSKPSGVRNVVRHLLAANGITKANATLIDAELDADAQPLLNNELDAAFLLMPPESPKVQKLLRNPALRLMNFGAEADAYVNRFPYLSKVELHVGAVEFAPMTPEADVTLITTRPALVVRKDLHPALIALLTYAAFQYPKAAFDKTGEPILFYRPGQFPIAADSEFDTAPDARAVQASHELPVLLRVLGPPLARMGLPFALTAFISEHGSQVLLTLIPLLSVALPLMRIAPATYNWTIRRRLLIWYRRLKLVERRMAALVQDPVEMAAIRAELDDIDNGVSKIRVPLAFSSQLYDLHMHINVVRQRLTNQVDAQPTARAA
jgi:uncharacterized protein